MRIKALAKIAVTPPVVIPDENMFLTVSGSCERISGTNSTLNPKEKLNAITNVALRSMKMVKMDGMKKSREWITGIM